MEKRAIIAVVLSLAFYYGYTLLFPPPVKFEAPNPVPVQAAATSSQITQSLPLPVVQQPLPKAVAVRDIQVDTDMFTAVFSNHGGTLKKLTLKKYRETSARDGEAVSLVSAINPEGYALGTESAAFGLQAAALYTSSAASLKISGAETKKLEFSWTSPQGISVKKIYTFSGDGYAITLDNQISNLGSNKVAGNLNLLLPVPAQPKAGLSRFETHDVVTLDDGAFSKEEVKEIDKEPLQYSANIDWTGYADKYFLSAVLSKDNSIASAKITKGAASYVDTTVTSPSFELQPGQTHKVEYRLFFGPKGLDILKAQGQGLEKALDLGWFAPLAKPLLYILQYFYNYTHNYGFAIIIITVIIKILFFPLTHKSYKSMKDMQKLQPKMAELKEKHKDDRDALNRSIMEMYRTHKVNPLGGCLPMIVQIPVFFALYKALMFSIELRHAPFMLWITDLSAKDPYYVTPIIMGATMFIQQKMTPTSMDPIQAKMMLALPIVFTFMFLNFPSGLVIYWLVNNVLTIAQQAYINRTLKDA
ncbi:MAG: membrane protein insertase YidC [Deltaproteobacteria bacterium]|nr:membrane protein insertase YidC [Deltaproteobacteria bacterium]TLN03858.1 MAG: membrane protein insertase YidC [bacterium]